MQEDDGSWSALPLSKDHNSDNEAEVERIRSMHPPSERDTVVTDGRLLGVSAPPPPQRTPCYDFMKAPDHRSYRSVRC